MIFEQLKAAQIILLLVSPDFMASDYCYSTEMRYALALHEQMKTHVIPIILRPVDWQESPLGKLQALPKDGRPVTDKSWHTLDYAFLSIVRGIREVTRLLSSQESDNPSGDLELSEALDVRKARARSLIQRLVKTLEDIDTTVWNADIRSLDELVDRRDFRNLETVLFTVFLIITMGIFLTFGDCWAYNFKWSLFSCSKKCLGSYYGRVFPKCEGEPKSVAIEHILCSC